ncbi:MAG: UDP-N-acetylmuramate dehydrogenase [Rickettsiales bacterium]|nr:UDP-N-acetylmuramate dehydrogenase [Rickettsiales bacterium]
MDESQLPKVRGRYRFGADLSKTNWFQVGGPAEVMFKPEDAEDLALFMREKPADLPVTVIGVGSNLIVRDGGIEGVVIRLGRGFAKMEREGDILTVGAGCLDVNVAHYSAECALSGTEFLSGIPGTIGGALAMNAGAYGSEIKDVLVEVQVVTPEAQVKWVSPELFNYAYRHADLPEGWIFTAAKLRGVAGDSATISARIDEIQKAREETQPIRSKTGGSTFRNPEGHKAWELVDKAGCRGLTIGDAQVSEKHCNFMINIENATAKDIETLGDEVRKRVKETSNIDLHWEIKRIGKVQ